jgi:cell division protein FtsW (lipid II flippase)
MPQPTNRRVVERHLLLFVLLILWSGFALVYFGKLATTAPPPDGAINVNTATAADLAQSLAISAKQATDLVSRRERAGGFASVYSLRHSPALKGVAVRWEPDRYYVRDVGYIARYYWAVAILLSFLALIAHVLLSRAKSSADPLLLPLTILLAGLGLILVFTVKDPYRDTFAFGTQAKGVIVFGLIAFAAPFTRLYQRLALHRWEYGFAVAALLLMLALLLFGHGPAGVRIQVLGFEPVEFIKVLLVFFVASYLSEKRMALALGARPRGLEAAREIVPLVAVYLFVLMLFGVIKDLGPAVLLFGAFITLLYLVTGRLIYPLAGLLLLVGAGAVGYKLGFGFFATRVQMWLHPWNNHDRLGGQLAQGLWGMATGGIWGSGLGLGDPASVPRAGSDMVFTTLGEELGLFGTLCVVVVFAVIIYRGFQIALKAPDEFDRLLAAGLTTLLGLQAIIITAGATGLLPLTGITLPFVSYGTSSLTADFFSIGVLMRISAKILPDKVSPAPTPVFIRTSRHAVLAFVGVLLIGVGICRLLLIQGWDDSATAARPLVIPDADGVIRPHINPRLTAYAAAIPRGRILDRNGKVLAASAEQGVTYFAGTPRSYPYGVIGSNIVYAVEQPASPTNPLGCDGILRGYGDPEKLLGYYRRKDLPFPPELKGDDVTLTLDIELQKTAQEALEKTANRSGNGRGAVVALDAKNGALLAAATEPTFDPNTIRPDDWNAIHSSLATGNPLLNRAFAGTYPPGSSFKLVTATAAFEQGKTKLVFDCNHQMPQIQWTFNGRSYTRKKITDEEGMAPHGRTDMAKAIRVSCNVYFAQLGVAVGAPALEQAISDYQLVNCPTLQKIGDDLPDCAYGQGAILVTPYQMARVAQTIAAGGNESEPLFFQSSSSPPPARRVLPAEDARALNLMMQGVVTKGTAEGIFTGLAFTVAGKTGSAQLAHGRTHSWFVGFAPADNPAVAFACVVEHGGQGREAAAPVCRAVLEKALR